jgi:hypothetical protein
MALIYPIGSPLFDTNQIRERAKNIDAPLIWPFSQEQLPGPMTSIINALIGPQQARLAGQAPLSPTDGSPNGSGK